VYLYLDEDGVKFLSASNLWGKTVRETNALLENKHGEDIETICIGPAGENGVKFAAVMASYYNAAARGGIGAVMGSKNLKAVAVPIGKGRVSVSDPDNFQIVVEKAREALAL